MVRSTTRPCRSSRRGSPCRTTIPPAAGTTTDAPGASRLFRFTQFELPWSLGPADGRYVVRPGPDGEPTHVVVLATVGTQPRKRFARRRVRELEPQAGPAVVPLSRATVVEVGEPFGGEEEAGGWLDAAAESGEEDTARALTVLNGVLRAHRAAAADPYARDVGAEQALAVRLGYGAGEQVADGRWARAIEVDARPRRPRRVAALRPQERLAALLTGRDRALACEELVLRARLDLDEGRPREAALQVRVALEAAVAELREEAGLGDMEERLGDLRERRKAIGAAANEALRGELGPARLQAVEEAVARLEAALRARAARGV